MAKTRKLFLAGVLPLAGGYLQKFMMYLPLGAFYQLVALALVVLWGYLAYRLSNLQKNPVVQSGMMCALGLLMLALVLYQELVLGHYWPNLIGTVTQVYFLPFLSAVSMVFLPVLSVLMPVIKMWPLYLCAWLCMFSACWIGCMVKGRKRFS